jgi:hypothetical protein
MPKTKTSKYDMRRSIEPLAIKRYLSSDKPQKRLGSGGSMTHLDMMALLFDVPSYLSFSC